MTKENIKNQRAIMNARLYRAQRLIRMGELLERFGPMVTLAFHELDDAHDDALEAEDGSAISFEVLVMRMTVALEALQRFNAEMQCQRNANYGVKLGDDLTLAGCTQWAEHELIAANTYKPETKS